MDRIPRVPAPRVTHVVSLAGAAIIVMPVLAFAGAHWLVYALVVAIWLGTVIAFTHNPTTGLTGENLLKAIQPELSQVGPDAEPQQKQHEDEPPLEDRRREAYEDNRGLFLGHYWEPSVKEGQKADVRVQLLAHRHPDGRKTPLEEGIVERVTYQLGENFEEETVVKRNRKDNFALEFSLYSPVLCLAKVEFNDDTEPLYLSRYIDFRLVAGASAQILYNVEAPTPRPWWRRMLSG